MAHSKKPFSKALRALMESKKISYDRLAKATKIVDPEGKGLSGAFIHLLTTEKRAPLIRHIELLASALEISPNHFTEYRQYVVSNKAKLLENKYGYEELLEELAAIEAREAEKKRTSN